MRYADFSAERTVELLKLHRRRALRWALWMMRLSQLRFHRLPPRVQLCTSVPLMKLLASQWWRHKCRYDRVLKNA